MTRFLNAHRCLKLFLGFQFIAFLKGVMCWHCLDIVVFSMYIKFLPCMAFITLCRYGEHMSIKIRTQNKHCLQYHWLFSKAMCKKHVIYVYMICLLVWWQTLLRLIDIQYIKNWLSVSCSVIHNIVHTNLLSWIDQISWHWF